MRGMTRIFLAGRNGANPEEFRFPLSVKKNWGRIWVVQGGEGVLTTDYTDYAESSRRCIGEHLHWLDMKAALFPHGNSRKRRCPILSPERRGAAARHNSP